MAQFMTNDKKQLPVIHPVHESAVYPDTAVGHGKGVDPGIQVNTNIKRHIVWSVEFPGHSPQPLRIFGVRPCHPVGLIELGGGLTCHQLNLGVGERNGSNGIDTGFGGQIQIGLLTSGKQKKRNDDTNQ